MKICDPDPRQPIVPPFTADCCHLWANDRSILSRGTSRSKGLESGQVIKKKGLDEGFHQAWMKQTDGRGPVREMRLGEVIHSVLEGQVWNRGRSQGRWVLEMSHVGRT